MSFGGGVVTELSALRFRRGLRLLFWTTRALVEGPWCLRANTVRAAEDKMCGEALVLLGGGAADCGGSGRTVISR